MCEHSKTVKTGVTIPRSILRKVEIFMKSNQIRSRSRVITEALRSYVLDRDVLMRNTYVVGSVLYVYDYERDKSVKHILKVKSDFRDVIVFSTNFSLEDGRLIELLVVKGNTSRIRRLIGALESLKCVMHVKFTFIEYPLRFE